MSGYGLVVIDKSLDQLALENIERIDVKGKLLASPQVRERFAAK